MTQIPFGAVSARISPHNTHGAIIITHEDAQTLRAHLQWMQATPLCHDLTEALKWIEGNTSDTARAERKRIK
jgi:hypothetical protein